MKRNIQPLDISPRYNRRDIEIVINKGRQTIWRMVKKGDLPSPQYINGQMSWDSKVILDWLSSLQTYEERQEEHQNEAPGKPK